VERSDTHQWLATKLMGFALLYPSCEPDFVLASRHRQKREATHGQAKGDNKSRSQNRVKKKWTGLGPVAKSSARKTIKSKGRVPAAKSKMPAKTKAATKARPKQRIAISHHREEDFKADGLRTYAQYRDLGIAEASQGLAQAHVIRLIGPCNPAEVSKLHYHDVEFQMVYVLKGWVKTYMDGQGETMMKAGSAWTQPPRIKHLILDYSDDVELLEVILPAEFKTVELTT
jgi:mannose-6-phosphate isomerase-like protein (cupin superfamily)